MSIAIMWFRRDLRCDDNPALSTACNRHEFLIPLYILERQPVIALGSAQCWWLHHSLEALSNNLQDLNLNLCLRTGDPLHILQEFIRLYGVNAIYWNHCYEPEALLRDKNIQSVLEQNGISIYNGNGSLLYDPGTIKNKGGEPYKVFTSFWNQCLRLSTMHPVSTVTRVPKNITVVSDNLESWKLLPKSPDWATEFSTCWQPGEQGAFDRLRYFVNEHLSTYDVKRNEPAKNATSLLSPHLHFGEISPGLIWRMLEQHRHQPEYNQGALDSFLSEIGWREFSYHLLYHFPDLPKKNLRTEFDSFPWQENDTLLRRWQKGLTGFPIIDAGMRQLWRTGFMHNRVRMIVASFLVKDLLVDWRAGAKWFLDTLLDADLANNSVSWQWVAGCGTDAAPYFRIFNPVLQSEKFDPQGIYIKQWVPELGSVPLPWLHKPWMAPKNVLKIRLGIDYPEPIVDHSEARARALAYYRSLK